MQCSEDDKCFEKTPSEVLDYKFDYASQLTQDGGVTISTSTTTVPTGLTKDSETNDTTSATVILSGGTVPDRYRVVNQMVTSGSKTYERYIIIEMVEVR